jgi:hypothetical protein
MFGFPSDPQRARAALDLARARYVSSAGTVCDLERFASYADYTRKAGRLAVALAETGADPRAVQSLHDMGAGALIGLSGASRARRDAAQRRLNDWRGFDAVGYPWPRAAR